MVDAVACLRDLNVGGPQASANLSACDAHDDNAAGDRWLTIYSCVQGSSMVDAVASFRNLNLGGPQTTADSSSSDDDDDDAARFRRSTSDDEVDFQNAARPRVRAASHQACSACFRPLQLLAVEAQPLCSLSATSHARQPVLAAEQPSCLHKDASPPLPRWLPSDSL